jgi:hypothetical protein
MAIDATKTTKIFQIFGIPEGGDAFVNFHGLSLFGPSGEAYDVSAIVTALNNLITAAAASSTITVQVEALLTRYDEITPTSVIKIWKSGSGSEGRIADHQLELKLIRKELANLIGFVNFMNIWDEARRFQGNSISR